MILLFGRFLPVPGKPGHYTSKSYEAFRLPVKPNRWQRVIGGENAPVNGLGGRMSLCIDEGRWCATIKATTCPTGICVHLHPAGLNRYTLDSANVSEIEAA